MKKALIAAAMVALIGAAVALEAVKLHGQALRRCKDITPTTFSVVPVKQKLDCKGGDA